MATTSKINVNDLTFGIEIETCIPRGTIQVGGYHAGQPIPALPEGWTAQHDGSIRCTHRFQPCEVVSPVLKGEAGVKQLIDALSRRVSSSPWVQPTWIWAYLRSIGAKVNRSTGLVTTVANFEKAIFATTGTRSRETGAFCRPIKTDGSYQRRYKEADQSTRPTNRYHVLNVQPLTREAGKRTVEFRAFAGTLNAGKVLGYLRLCLGLVEKALSMTRPTNWDAKRPVETSPIHRGGEGQTELTRLFYFLGWTKGREQHTFGNVTCTGAPRINTVKKELMRLAKKYDTGN